MLRFIINPLWFLFVLLWPCLASGSTAALQPKWQVCDLVPTTAYVGWDVAKMGQGWYRRTGNAYEFHGSIDTSRIVWNLDYGFGKIKRDALRKGGSFSHTQGRYVRIGAGYSLLAPTLQRNVCFIGLYYAKSYFDFQIKSNKLACGHAPEKPCEPACRAPDALQHLEGDGRANWWEIVAGTKVHVASFWAIGCTMRYKFAQKPDGIGNVLPFDLPGWGLREDANAFGCSAYVLCKIPLREGKLKLKGT